MSNKPQAYSGFTQSELERIAHAVPIHLTANYVACLINEARRIAESRKGTLSLGDPNTHIAVDGTTHKGQAHPCALCDAMERHLIPDEGLREPKPNHNPYHNYVTLDGKLTDKAVVLLEFADKVRRNARETAIEYENRWGSQ